MILQAVLSIIIRRYGKMFLIHQLIFTSQFIVSYSSIHMLRPRMWVKQLIIIQQGDQPVYPPDTC